MTSRRYAHYRRALRWIGSLDGADVDARSIETLRGSVQDLLLSREVSTDTVEVEQRAALALTRMTLAGVLSRARRQTRSGAPSVPPARVTL